MIMINPLKAFKAILDDTNRKTGEDLEIGTVKELYDHEGHRLYLPYKRGVKFTHSDGIYTIRACREYLPLHTVTVINYTKDYENPHIMFVFSYDYISRIVVFEANTYRIIKNYVAEYMNTRKADMKTGGYVSKYRTSKLPSKKRTGEQKNGKNKSRNH